MFYWRMQNIKHFKICDQEKKVFQNMKRSEIENQKLELLLNVKARSSKNSDIIYNSPYKKMKLSLLVSY